MASTPELDDERGRLGSLDLTDSTRPEMRSNAAAWMWHTHMSPTSVKNESLQLQYGQRQAAAIDAAAWKSCKKRSSSRDRKERSRFRQVAGASPPPRLMREASQPSSCGGGWDCGSELYDTFELVSFSNRLDRSLLGVPALEDPLHHSSVRNLRTLSLPRTLSLQATPNFEMARPSVHIGSVDAASTNHEYAHVQGSLVAATKSKSSTYLSKWLAKFVTKLVSIHGQNIWCFKPFILERVEETSSASAIGGGMSEKQRERERYRVYEEKVKEGHKHFHHHHHHYYHHHVLHHLDQSSTQDAELHNSKPSMTSPRAESARLSFETMSKICADKIWL